MAEKKHRIDLPYRENHPEIKPYMQEIATAFTQLYPLASATNTVLAQAAKGDVHFYALDTQSRDKKTLLAGIELALALAVDENRPTYSSHGFFRHKTFHEVISVLRNLTQKAPEQLQLSLSTRIVDDELQPSFTLESPDYVRNIYRPHAISWVMQLARSHKDISHDHLYRRLRQVTAEKGIAFGVMAAIYAGVPEAETLRQIFHNRDLIRSLRAKGWSTIPSESRTSDYQLINDLWKVLMVRNQGMIYPSYRPESYGEALVMVNKAQWVPDQDELQPWYYEFDQTQDIVKALAVFTSGRHAVHDILLTKTYAPETRNLLQPAIDQEYGAIMTSRVKIGYFLFKNYRNLWTPQQ